MMKQSSKHDAGHQQPVRRVVTALAVAAVAAVVVGCSTSTAAEDGVGSGPATPVAASTPASLAPGPTSSGTATGTDADAAADVQLLTQQFAPVHEGTWEARALGTSFEVDIEGAWWVQPNEPGLVVLSDPDSRGPGEFDVVFIRPTALSDPTDPGSGEPWPVDDIEGWLASTDAGVVAAPVEDEVGGVKGIVFEVELTRSTSFPFVENAAGGGKEFFPGHRYVVHWLDQGEHAPIAIVVGARTPEIDEWRPTAASLLETVRFGEPAPHPSA